MRIHSALTLDPLCASAYQRQGELEEGVLPPDSPNADGLPSLFWEGEEKREFLRAKFAYEKAMRIAALLVGPEVIASAEASAGTGTQIWFTSDAARTYLRARASLARLLWKKGRDPRRAIPHFHALLQLDSDDHQGCRHALLCVLLEVGDDEALDDLLARYASPPPLPPRAST